MLWWKKIFNFYIGFNPNLIGNQILYVQLYKKYKLMSIYGDYNNLKKLLIDLLKIFNAKKRLWVCSGFYKQICQKWGNVWLIKN